MKKTEEVGWDLLKVEHVQHFCSLQVNIYVMYDVSVPHSITNFSLFPELVISSR